MKAMTNLCVAVAILLLMTACGNSAGKPASDSDAAAHPLTWQEQYDLGLRYLVEGNYSEAIIAFTAAIEIDAKHPEAYIGRGNALVFEEESEINLTAAQRDYEKAIELDETIAEAYLGIADIHIRRGNYDIALDVLRDALEKVSDIEAILSKISQIESGVYSDSSGNIRRQITYENGAVAYSVEFDYDKTGNKTRATSFDGAGSVTNQVDIVYNSNGDELESYLQWNDGIVRKVAYEYNESGDCTKSTEYNLDGSISTIGERQYDSGGNLMRIDWSNSDGVFGSYLYEYNLEGLRSKLTHILTGGDVAWSETFAYDTDGNTIKINVFDGDGSLEKWWEYDYENGERIESREIAADGTLLATTKYDRAG